MTRGQVGTHGETSLPWGMAQDGSWQARADQAYRREREREVPNLQTLRILNEVRRSRAGTEPYHSAKALIERTLAE